jgi:tRNA-specific 2-thiouridylase
VKVLRRNLAPDSPALSPGPFLDVEGRPIGQHDGYAGFTVGQRRGLPGGFREPMFVIEIRPEARAVVLGPRTALLGRGVVAREMNWLVSPAPGVGDRVAVQIRHRSAAASAEIIRVEGEEIELALDEPLSAIAPGQSLVVYDGDRVLGGGVIERQAGVRQALPVFAA